MDMNSKYIKPSYKSTREVWRKIRDCFRGEDVIKLKGTDYLPLTDNMYNQTQANAPKTKKAGWDRYDRYKNRSIYYEYLSNTITAMLGVMYAEEPSEIVLPKALEGYMESATTSGDGLVMLLRRINEEQFITGRVGLLLEPYKNLTYPKILNYYAENIINWNTYVNDDGEEVYASILLDESSYATTGFETNKVEQYRLLALDGEGYYYTMAIYDLDYLEDLDILNPGIDAVYPELQGNKLTTIPFVIINSSSITAEITKPPMLALANITLAIYRGEANYRQHLYESAQDTLFVSGIDTEKNPIIVGSGSYISTKNPEAKASYIGVNPVGLSEERQSLENLCDKAISMGLSFMENQGAESGEALKTRLSIRTASMKTIALTATSGLTNLLTVAAQWMGISEQVVITPNLDFSSSTIQAAQLVVLWKGIKEDNLPMSEESFHKFMRDNQFTDKTYEVEKELIGE